MLFFHMLAWDLAASPGKRCDERDPETDKDIPGPEKTPPERRLGKATAMIRAMPRDRPRLRDLLGDRER